MNATTSNTINLTLSVDELQLVLLALDVLLFNVSDDETHEKTISRLLESKKELGLIYDLTQAEKTPQSFADASIGQLSDHLMQAWTAKKWDLLDSNIRNPKKCMALGFAIEHVRDYLVNNPQRFNESFLAQVKA